MSITVSNATLPNQQYHPVSYDPGRDHRVKILHDTPWTFRSYLPFAIKVYSTRPPRALELIAELPAHGTIKTCKTKNGCLLQAGDTIHVTRTPPVHHAAPGTNGPEYEILRPVVLIDDSRSVVLGDVRYNFTSRTEVISSHADIFGFRIHNHITIPMQVMYKGKVIAEIAGDDGTGYMSGSPGSVYVTNNSYGFNVGDQLGFVFKHDGRRFVSVMLPDNHISDIYVGDITQTFDLEIQDQWAYRMDTKNIGGLAYFATNKCAAYGF